MRTISALCVLGLSSLGVAQETYLGMYLQGQKIGYASYLTTKTTLNGKSAKRNDSKTYMSLGLLGTPMTVNILSTTWTTMDGKPIKMTFSMDSAGRTQNVLANFGSKKVEVDINNSGSKSHQSLDLPRSGSIVDDPLTLVNSGKKSIGQKRSFYVFDATTVSIIKNDIKIVGPTKTTVRGKPMMGTLVEITDPRATMSVFMTKTGDLLKVEGPMGIEMLPESKLVAMGMSGKKYAPSIDLAFSTSIATDKPIDDPRTITGLELKISGRDLSKLPSDQHQTVKKADGGWLVSVHPPKIDSEPGVSVEEAAKQKPDWIKPSLNIPSDTGEFTHLAKKIVGDKTDVHGASLAIKKYVYDLMRPNAGIGVLRNASEVLKTKEGVCRDYAILTCTILRAAGIPARLASGLVNWDGKFYYHAWCESWDGARWIGLDSTVPEEQISAGHVKLGDGNVESAFTFAVLDHVKVKVLNVKRD